MSIELCAESVYDGAGELLEILGGYTGLDLLDQSDIGLVDVDDIILALIGEEILDNVIGGHICLGGDLDQHDDTADIAVEAQLARLEIDISGQDIVEDNILYKIGAIVLFIIILLDRRERNCKELSVLLSDLVAALYKNGIVGSV